MSVAIITGSAGLVGSEAAAYFSGRMDAVIGIDCDMRSEFFGGEASTKWMRNRLLSRARNYLHFDLDIRDVLSIERLFSRFGEQISLVIHAAAQPSHDWAAKDPATDFSINATGTSILLEATRKFSPDAVFIFMSTNKVYGTRPNEIELTEHSVRFDTGFSSPYFNGIDETMSIDATLHSLFGASKAAADLLVQEYGRYFGMSTVCFRAGCLTGPNHSGAELHGFLAYMMKCAIAGKPYSIFGHKGKQVRDNLHSADLVRAFDEFYKKPHAGAVYNIGGGRQSNCSVLEAINLCEHITGKELAIDFQPARRGDHVWWISDTSAFRKDYPAWRAVLNVPEILQEIYLCSAVTK